MTGTAPAAGAARAAVAGVRARPAATAAIVRFRIRIASPNQLSLSNRLSPADRLVNLPQWIGALGRGRRVRAAEAHRRPPGTGLLQHLGGLDRPAPLVARRPAGRPDPKREWLPDYDRFAVWAGFVGLVAPSGVDRIRVQARISPGPAGAVVGRAHRLRHQVYRMLTDGSDTEAFVAFAAAA